MTGQPCFVRVTGTLGTRFVQFEFAIGDPELSVDLVMQFDQFHEFCERHNAPTSAPKRAHGWTTSA